MSGAPQGLCWPPPLTSQSSPQLFCLFTAQMLPSLQQRWLTVWHTPAFIHKDTRATRPRSLIAMEPFDPVPVRVFEPALCTHPNQAINTFLLVEPRTLDSHGGTPSTKQQFYDLPRLLRNGDRYSKQSAHLKPEGSPKNNLTEIAILSLKNRSLRYFLRQPIYNFFSNNLAVLSIETAEKS